MSEASAETNLPAETPAGVDAASTATDDDIDTSKFDRMEAPDEDGTDQTPAGDGEGEEGEQSDADKAKAAAEADTVEVELDDGSKVRIPKAAEPAFLRHADYTRKTQEVGEQRRALEVDRTSWESQKADSLAELPEEHALVAVIDHTIASVTARLDAPIDAQGLTLRGIDWRAYRAMAEAEGGDRLDQYKQHRAAFDGAEADLADLARESKAAKENLATREGARLKDQATKAAAASAEAWGVTEAALADEKTGIPGWSPEKAATLTKIAVEEFRVTRAELQNMTDPRQWRLFAALQSTRDELAKAQTALKQKTTADNHGKAQTTTPAATVKGSGASARDPATPRGDALATKEWMTRRNAQKAQATR